MASSSSGGSGTSGGSRPPSGGGGSGGYSGGQPPRSGGGGTGGRDSGQSPFSSSSRPTRPTVPAGQERQVSYQREEERYWTDYLRVALPVVGLLLMLGLFWYWAGSLIGDDDDEEPTQVSQVLTSPSPTPTEPQTIAISPTQGNSEAAQTDTQEDPDPTPTDESEEADGQQADSEDDTTADGEGNDQEEPVQDSKFSIDDVVIVTEEGDPLNMRDQPSLEGGVVESYGVGTQLTVVGDTFAANDYFWVEVEDVDGRTGYVADEFLELSE